jgi:hypothetical protein
MMIAEQLEKHKEKLDELAKAKKLPIDLALAALVKKVRRRKSSENSAALAQPTQTNPGKTGFVVSRR